VTDFVFQFDRFRVLLGRAFFWLAVVAAVLFALDWAVRTRRINPFGPLAQFLRKYVDPFIAPVERRIVRAGGMPHSAPWWTLGAVVVGGAVFLWMLDAARNQFILLAASADSGPRGLARVAVIWTFNILQLALLVRVLSSWISVSPYSRWIKWSFVLSEPILRPLRGFIPLIGMIDITPIVAWLLLSFTRGILLGMLM
jgi:YggT family protein